MFLYPEKRDGDPSAYMCFLDCSAVGGVGTEGFEVGIVFSSSSQGRGCSRKDRV